MGMRIPRLVLAPLLALAAASCASSSSSVGASPPAADPAPVSPHGQTEAEPEVPPPLVEGTDYAVFRGDGTRSSMAEIVEAADTFEVVFFGEQHDDPVTHRVQAFLLGRLYQRYHRLPDGPNVHPGAPGVETPSVGGERTVVLSLEMFERDGQYVVDEYLADLITESHVLSSSRPWDYYEERYRPMVEFARAHGLDIVAANAPRRYVNRASRLGRDSLTALPPSAAQWLPPLPYPEGSPDYQAEWDALMGPAAAHMTGTPFDAQTLWDASMGQMVARAVDEHQDALVLHLAGSFHVANFTGTPEALQHYRPGTRALVLVAEPGDVEGEPGSDQLGLGDFVIVTRPPDSPH